MFYGWYVVYALCLVITFTSGLIFYNLSVLLDAFVTQRGFPVGISSIATGSFFVAAGIAGLIAGYLIDRIDARIVMIASACVGALALGTVDAPDLTIVDAPGYDFRYWALKRSPTHVSFDSC